MVINHASDFSGIRGWECNVDVSDNLDLVGWTYEGDGIDIGNIPGDIMVAISVPRPWSNTVLLATFVVMANDAGPGWLTIGPKNNNSSCDPPAPCYINAINTIFPLTESSGGARSPVFWVNLAATDVPDNPLPDSFALHPAQPNPFNPRTSIAFDLPAAGSVRLQIFDVSGRLIRTLVSAEQLAAGRNEYTWDGRDDGGREVASGVYFSHLVAGEFRATQRMALVR